MSDCIFVDRPKECSTCIQSKMLQCLLNKEHLKVKKEAIPLLQSLLAQNINSSNRYKDKSGEAGRK